MARTYNEALRLPSHRNLRMPSEGLRDIPRSAIRQMRREERKWGRKFRHAVRFSNTAPENIPPQFAGGGIVMWYETYHSLISLLTSMARERLVELFPGLLPKDLDVFKRKLPAAVLGHVIRLVSVRADGSPEELARRITIVPDKTKQRKGPRFNVYLDKG